MNPLLTDILTNPAVITAIAGFFAWLITRLFLAKPEWQKYEGLMISAVKIAEKIIPDDTPNTSLARFNAALQAFIDQYKIIYASEPPPALFRQIAANIPVIHDDLEFNETLKK